MDENNININEEVEKPIYTSNFLMSRDLFYEFYLASYNKLKKIFFVFLCMTVFIIAVNIGVKNYGVVVYSLFTSFLMLLLYFTITRAKKINYKRNLISAGKEQTLNEEIFEDKIVSSVDGLKRAYYYNQITKFLETKNLLLLHLQYNVCIVVNKGALNADVDEVKSFLIEKCPFVNKKKFIDCSNDKKWSLIFLITLIALSVFGSIISLILEFIALF